MTVNEGGNGPVSKPGMNVSPRFRPISRIPLDRPPARREEWRLHGIEALDDAPLERAASRRERHEALGLSDLRDTHDAEGAEPGEGGRGWGKLDVITSNEDRVDAEGREHAGGVDANHRVIHALKLPEKAAILVRVHDAKVLAEVRGKAPGVSGIDGMGNGSPLQVLRFEAVAVARQDSIVVVSRVEVPCDHELAGG